MTLSFLHLKYRQSLRPLVVIATLLVALIPVGAGAMPTADNQPGGGWIEPQAGSWHTWATDLGSQFRPGPPPDEATTQAELNSTHYSVLESAFLQAPHVPALRNRKRQQAGRNGHHVDRCDARPCPLAHAAERAR
jgi:hypothetical protein